RDREVGECLHSPPELLSIAHAVELLFVSRYRPARSVRHPSNPPGAAYDGDGRIRPVRWVPVKTQSPSTDRIWCGRGRARAGNPDEHEEVGDEQGRPRPSEACPAPR